MSRGIEKITVSLPEETLRIADENHKRFGFENRSEFINAAIREYVSRDMLREFGSEIADVYSKIQHSEIRNLRNISPKLSYKIAVEMAQMNLFLASIMEFLPRYTETPGQSCEHGKQQQRLCTLSAAVKHRTEIRYMEDDEDDILR